MIIIRNKLPWEDNVFDAVVSYDTMIHFHRWEDFLKEHVRVVKPGGFVIYNMYNDDHLLSISDAPYVRAAYLKADGRNAYATVTKSRLERVCEELQNVKLVEMIPYDFFTDHICIWNFDTR